jgi:hypothetical protein
MKLYFIVLFSFRVYGFSPKEIKEILAHRSIKSESVYAAKKANIHKLFWQTFALEGGKKKDIDFHFGPKNIGFSLAYVLRKYKLSMANFQDYQALMADEAINTHLKFQDKGIIINNNYCDFLLLDAKKNYLLHTFESSPLTSLSLGGRLWGQLFYKKTIKNIEDFYHHPENFRFLSFDYVYEVNQNHQVIDKILIYLCYKNKIYFFSTPQLKNFPIQDFQRHWKLWESPIKTMALPLDNRLIIPRKLKIANGFFSVVGTVVSLCLIGFLVWKMSNGVDKLLNKVDKRFQRKKKKIFLRNP